MKEIPVFNTNSVDPDQMPHSGASHLGMHCLPITIFDGLQTKMGYSILFGNILLFMQLCLKLISGIANSSGAVCSGSALFAHTNLSEILVYKNFRILTVK